MQNSTLAKKSVPSQKKEVFYTSWQKAHTAIMQLGIESQDEYKNRRQEDPMLPHNPEVAYPNFPSWVKFLRRNPGDPAKFIPSPVVELPPEPEVSTDESDKAYVPGDDPVLDMVLRYVSKESNVSTERLLGHGKDAQAFQARYLAMYILREDFNRSYLHIARSFGKKEGGAVWNAYNKFVSDYLSNPDVQRILKGIKPTYTLSGYQSLAILEQYQTRLFPTQLDEARKICAELKQKLDEFIKSLKLLTLNDRHREVFRLHYGFENVQQDYARMTLEAIGNQFDLTRARISQLNLVVWSRIRQSDSVLIKKQEDLLQVINDILILDKLIRAS